MLQQDVRSGRQLRTFSLRNRRLYPRSRAMVARWNLCANEGSSMLDVIRRIVLKESVELRNKE